jgi:two-component system sensor histidine kinase UhpB
VVALQTTMRTVLQRSLPAKGPPLPLFWHVFLINGAVFALGTAVLAFSPATVSSPVVTTELTVLAVGLAVILVANGLLLHRSLSPLDRLARLMGRVDLLRPGERLAERGNGVVADLVDAFDAMLDRLEAERGASAERALAAQEGERHRIAQELHDEVGQSLTVVLLGLSRVAAEAPSELREELALIQEAARSSLDDVREVARRLRPGVLDDLGLESSLHALADEFSRMTGTPVRRSFDPDLPPLGDDVDLVVYRIAQEGLTNVARHAHARHVGLALGVEDGGVTLELSDDGVGIADHGEGAGIRGMRERAMLVGAQLDVVPGRGGPGTVLRLVVPRAGRARR